MPVNLLKKDLLDEVVAFLRAEETTRKRWRQRAWIGRRAVFARLEAFTHDRWWAHFRRDDGSRERFVAEAMDLLEEMGALDLLSAGRWAESSYEHPTDATRVPDRGRGELTPSARRFPRRGG